MFNFIKKIFFGHLEVTKDSAEVSPPPEKEARIERAYLLTEVENTFALRRAKVEEVFSRHEREIEVEKNRLREKAKKIEAKVATAATEAKKAILRREAEGIQRKGGKMATKVAELRRRKSQVTYHLRQRQAAAELAWLRRQNLVLHEEHTEKGELTITRMVVELEGERVMLVLERKAKGTWVQGCTYGGLGSGMTFTRAGGHHPPVIVDILREKDIDSTYELSTELLQKLCR